MKEHLDGINKFMKINELAHEIQELQDDIKLNDFIPDRIKNNLKIKRDRIVFAEIDLEDYEIIKFIIDKQKDKNILNLGYIKIDLWVPTFPNGPVTKDKLKYDLVLSGSGILLWPLGLLFGGRWLEEHLFFINENFDDKYKNYDSWNNEKYIPKQMREKVSELIKMIGNAPFNILCSPVETYLLKSCGKSQKNLIDLRIKLFSGLKTNSMEMFKNLNSEDISSFKSEVYHIYIAIIVSEFGIADIPNDVEIVNDKFAWSREIESHLGKMCSLFGLSKHNVIPFMSELFCIETRNELFLTNEENDKLIKQFQKDIIGTSGN